MNENHSDLARRIHELWEGRRFLSPENEDARRTVFEVISLLDAGHARVAEWEATGEVVVHEWLKLAILLLFTIMEMETIELGPFEFADRIPLKKGYQSAGVRVVPGASARWGSHLAAGVILMPSYVNIGANVGTGTLVDTWATVGSCAQIGSNVHLSGGVGIGGVIEPPNATPVMIGDGAFVGSRCMVTDGARVGEGAVLGAGVILNPSIPVVDAHSGEELSRGVVPPWSVAVAASRPREFAGGEFHLPCVLVLKRLEPGERHDKVRLNEIIREHGIPT